MRIRKLTHDDGDFYACLGPIFGSRLIEKQTRDRFYDDPGKVWYLIPGEGAASLLEGVIKNFWASSAGAAGELIAALQAEQKWLDGIVPRTHEETFRQRGFVTKDYRINFVEVHWHEED